MEIIKKVKCGPFLLHPGDNIRVVGDINDGMSGIDDYEYLKYEFTEEDGTVEVDTVYIVKVEGELGLEIGYGGIVGKGSDT